MKKTTAPSSHEGTTGARAPKLYRQLQHRCTTPVLKTTVQLDPLRQSRFGPRGKMLSQIPLLMGEENHRANLDSAAAPCSPSHWPSAPCWLTANAEPGCSCRSVWPSSVTKHRCPCLAAPATGAELPDAGGSVLNRSSNGIEREMRYRGQRQ
jgi:hypothetical protein